MPQPASTRLALVGPTGTDALSIGDDQIRAIVTQLEAVAAGYIVDVAANRPAAAAANKGYAFIATDTGIASWSTGSAWVDVNPKDAVAGTASLRTLGTGATQAAAGNHDHAGVYQPLDSDLTAIAALSTTSFGRSLLAAADAAALRTLAAVVPPKGGTVNVTVPNTSGAQGAFPATVVTHGLGASPSMAMAQWSTSPPSSFGTPRSAILACDTFTSTQLTIRGDTGTNIAQGTYAVNWIAVA